MTTPNSAQTWENPVTARMRQGRPVLGLTITVNSMEVAARGASLGFDFLWVEMEHSPVSLETLRQIVLATRGSRAVPFARVPVNEPWMAKRVLDMGVCGVMFPFTSTPELAKQAAQSCKYPPAGCRGSGPVLAMASWPERSGYHDSADKNVLVVTVIEQECAVDSIDQIAATPGVDVLFIGTNDLSFSLGLRGQQKHPRLEAAIAKVTAAAKKHGKFLGRPLSEPHRVPEFVEQGFLFFQATTDLGLMEMGARQLLTCMEQDKPAPAATPHT